MSDTFGDVEPDDVYAVGEEPAPEQVARRLHELRRYVDRLAGADPGDFDELAPEEQSLAFAIGEVVVEWLLTTDPDTPETTARHLHGVRRYWSGNALPPWDDVPPDQREVGVELLRQVIDWLRAEGSLP